MITHNEQGRTMLEMLGVIAIMGIIVYGAIAGINYGMSSYKINQTYTEVQNIVQGIQDLYSWSRGYPDGDAMMTAACNNDIFSAECTDGNTVSSQFGQINIAPLGDQISGTSPPLYPNFKVTIVVPNPSDKDRLTEMDWPAIHVWAEEAEGNMVFRPL